MIRDYLRAQQVPFEVTLVPPSPTSSRRAQAAHVPGRRVAKGVLVKADGRFVLAVLSATHRVDLMKLGEALGLGEVALASEAEVERVFADCERGARPPLGRLYGVPTVLDPSLQGGEILFEGNFRHEAVRMQYGDYEAMERPLRATFAEAVVPAPRFPD